MTPQTSPAEIGPALTAPPVPGSNRFAARLAAAGLELRRCQPAVLQLNVGKRCNLACSHCHVAAGPARKEMMTRETVERVLAWQRRTRLPVVDLTGGAPELLPDFRFLVTQLRAAGPETRIIDRCNLTILLEPGFEDLAGFLAQERVEIVASLPCYTVENVDAQRGDGVFDASIRALQLLNRWGYGRDPDRPLHLVYNPGGAMLPGPQAELEADYKRELARHFGIVFNHLYALANLPIARFASWLRHEGKLASYMETLVAAFNPATVAGLMCRDTISVGWRGDVFDCDFNQMLEMRLGGRSAPIFLWEIDPGELAGAPIATGEHCFGCTAGAGSSCGGAVLAAS